MKFFILLCCSFLWLKNTYADHHPLLLSVEEQAWLAEHPSIRVANDMSWAPFDFVKGGNATGFSIDLLRFIAKRLNIRLQFINGYTWDELLAMGKSGEVDVFPAIWKTPEREQFLHFSQAYVDTPHVLIVAADNQSINSIKALYGKKIAAVRGYASTELLQKHFPEIQLHLVNSPIEGLRQVAYAKVDAYLGTLGSSIYEIRSNLIPNLKVATETHLDGHADAQPLHMAVRHDWKIFQQILDKTLATLTWTERQNLLDKWLVLPTANTRQKSLQLTEAEQDWLHNHPVIKVVVDSKWAPIEFIDDKGELQGITADYLRKLEQIVGIHFHINKTKTWAQGLEKIKQHELDMISSVKQLAEREPFLNFTEPYLSLPMAIFARQDVPFIADLSMLSGKKVVVVKGYATHIFLEKYHPQIPLIIVNDIAAALEKLDQGEAYAFVGSILTTSYYLGKLGLSHIRVVGETPYEWNQSIGVRKDWPELTSILNKAFATISLEEHNAIFRRWVTVKYEHGFDYQRLWQIIAFFMLILLFILHRHYQLLQHRKAQTHIQLALEKSEEKFRDLFNESVAAIYVLDAKKYFIDVNDAGERLLGYNKEQLLSMNFTDIDLEPDSLEQTYQPLLRGGCIHNHEQQLRCQNGHIITVLNNSRALKEDPHSTRIIGIQSTLIDITERNQAIAKLQEREQTYRALVETTHTGYLIINEQGMVLDANAEYIRLTGHYKLEQIQGHNILEWTAEHDKERNAQAINRCLHLGFFRDLQIDYIHENAHIIPIEVNATVVTDNHKTRILALCRDITERRKQEAHILHQAHFDPLTELPNRLLALNNLEQLIKDSKRNYERGAVLFLDLDDFKKINDTLGHDVGDILLQQATQRLLSTVRDNDIVARLGGDEFIVLLGRLKSISDVSRVAEGLLNSFRHAFLIHERELILTVSIGIAIYPDDGYSASELLRNADAAMYHSKEQGRNTYSFFTESMNEDVSQRLRLEEQMHGALKRQEFQVYYQPQVELKSGKIIGCEALLRWHNPVLGQVSPVIFIPVAEQTGLIIPLGKFVLTEALASTAQWQRSYTDEFTIAINLSPSQFRDPNLVNFVKQAIQESQVDAKSVELEITEGVLMSGHAYIDDALQALSQLGISISMDDFGTGYSSLSYLRNYPFNVLKIDKEFIQDLNEDPADRELVNAAIAMAHGLGLKVVAEGVETQAQWDLLSAQQCDYGQGNLFSLPLAKQKITKLLEKGTLG